MTEKTEKVVVNDRRTVDTNGEVTLEGKRLEEVQKEKMEKAASVADQVSTQEDRKPLKDEHFTKLENYTLKVAAYQREIHDINMEATAYFNQIAREYYPEGTRVRPDLVSRSIVKVKDK